MPAMADYVIVPADRLAAGVLDKLLGEVALRDDTDYTDHPRTLEERVRLARRSLERGELVIVFDPQTETVSVMDRRQLPAEARLAGEPGGNEPSS